MKGIHSRPESLSKVSSLGTGGGFTSLRLLKCQSFAPELDLHFDLPSSSALREQSVGLNTQSFVNQFLLVSLCLSVHEHTVGVISIEENLYNT